MDPVRVLHVIESDGLYGAEQVVLALARQAAGDDRFPAAIGCLVKDPAAPHALYEHARAAGLHAVKLRLRNAQSPFDVAALASSCRRIGAGLLHAHGYKAAVAGYAAHVLARTPIVATCHLWFEDSDAKWTYRALSVLERRLYKRFDHVIAVSGPIANRLREWRVPPDRLDEISNGIATDAPSPSPGELAAARARCGAPAGTFLAVNVGRLADQKAQMDLIDAAARVRAQGVDLRVAILGEGHLRPALEARIAALDLQESIRLLGFEENVRPYLAAADAFVLPSVDEGLPIALLEALVAAVPVVCTPVGGIPRLLANGTSALFVPVHDVDALGAAIVRLVSDRALRARLAAGGRDAVVRAHSADAMYRAYRAIYTRVTNPAGENHDATRR